MILSKIQFNPLRIDNMFFSNYPKSQNMSSDKVCLKHFELTCIGACIPSREAYHVNFPLWNYMCGLFQNQPKNFRFPQHSFGVKKHEQGSFQPSWFDSTSGFIAMSFVYVGLSTRRFGRQNLNNLYIFNGYSTEKTLVYLFKA